MNTSTITIHQKEAPQAGRSSIERQLKAGKKLVRERIALLVDPESFQEVDQHVTSPFLKRAFQTDGVITGFATVNGARIALYAQDFTLKGGSLGKHHAQKICKIMDTAAKIGCPIIGIIDSGGARIDEGIHALAGYGEIFLRNTRLSGVIPQISVVVGPCAGGAVYSPSLTDFIFTTKGISQLFITGPQVIKTVLGQDITKESLGGTDVHAKRSGVVHFVAPNEEACFASVKRLLSYLPSNYKDEPQTTPSSPPHKKIDGLVPENSRISYDICSVIAAIVDEKSFFEVHPGVCCP